MPWIMARPKQGIPTAAKLELLRRALAERPKSAACLAQVLPDQIVRAGFHPSAALVYGRQPSLF
jgi:hypothetical protein